MTSRLFSFCRGYIRDVDFRLLSTSLRCCAITLRQLLLRSKGYRAAASGSLPHRYTVVKRKEDRYFRSRDVRLMSHKEGTVLAAGAPPRADDLLRLPGAAGNKLERARRLCLLDHIPLSHRALIIARHFHCQLPRRPFARDPTLILCTYSLLERCACVARPVHSPAVLTPRVDNAPWQHFLTRSRKHLFTVFLSFLVRVLTKTHTSLAVRIRRLACKFIIHTLCTYTH